MTTKQEMSPRKRRSPWWLWVLGLVVTALAATLLWGQKMLGEHVIWKPALRNGLLVVMYGSFVVTVGILLVGLTRWLLDKARRSGWSYVSAVLMWGAYALGLMMVWGLLMFSVNPHGTFEVDGERYYYEDRSFLDRWLVVGQANGPFTVELTKTWWSEGGYDEETLVQIVKGTVEQGHVEERD